MILQCPCSVFLYKFLYKKLALNQVPKRWIQCVLCSGRSTGQNLKQYSALQSQVYGYISDPATCLRWQLYEISYMLKLLNTWSETISLFT